MYMNVFQFFGVIFAAVLCAQLVLSGIMAFIATSKAYMKYSLHVGKMYQKEVLSKVYDEDEEGS